MEKDEELQQQLGPPVRPGHWYNAAVGVRPGRQAVDCSMQLSGAQNDATANIQVQSRVQRSCNHL